LDLRNPRLTPKENWKRKGRGRGTWSRGEGEREEKEGKRHPLAKQKL